MAQPKNPAAVALGRLGGKPGVKNPLKGHYLSREQSLKMVAARQAKRELERLRKKLEQ